MWAPSRRKEISAGCCAAPAERLDAIRLLRRWRHRWRFRRALASLLERVDGEYLLADIGLDREAARHESRKPFWQE